MIQKYGVKYAMQNPELSQKFSESLSKTHATGQYIEKRRKNMTKIMLNGNIV